MAKLVLVAGNDHNTAIDCLPPIITVVVVMTKYLNGVFRVKQLKAVLNMIKSDSERLMSLPEHDVLYTYAMQGRTFCVFFVVALYGLLAIYLLLPTMLIANDIITKNKTDEKYLMYPVSYIFFDEQEYYFVPTAQSYVESILILTFICPLDTMYIIFTQHACAIFAVAGHRLKTVHNLNMKNLRKEIGQRRDEKLVLDEQEQMYEKLILCVKEHKRALECTEIVQATFSATLFIQIMLNILCLSITGVQALLRKSVGSMTEVIRLVTWMMGQHIHLFFLYLPGQRVHDFSTQMYFDAMECMWYNCLTKSRVIYQVMVMNTLSPVKFTALKVASLNMESFLSVTQAAVSYFTILSSTV